MKEILKVDICIVGSGFCGYAAYKKFLKENKNVLLIEGGDYQTPKKLTEQTNYTLKTNKYIGNPEDKLIKSDLEPSYRDRKYTVGGSSECWTGWIKPFDSDTYKNVFPSYDKEQTWGKMNLSKYNEISLNLVKSPINDFSPEVIANKLDIELPTLPNGLFYTTYAWAPSPLRLKSYWKSKLVNSPDKLTINKPPKIESTSKPKNVLIGYKLIEVKSDPNNNREFLFKNKKGAELIVKAKYYMLCMGGIENARTVSELYKRNKLKNLKMSKIGNFQEHPHIYHFCYFKKGRKEIPSILKDTVFVDKSSGDDFKKGRLYISIGAWDGPGTPRVAFQIFPVNKEKPRGFVPNLKARIKPFFRSFYFLRDYVVHMRAEQTPNFNSRINFDKKDTSLNWEIIDSDFRYYSKYLKRFSSFLIANGYAESFKLIVKETNNFAIPDSLDGGAHHMGTVPFLQSDGIINYNFSLKSFENIYVVGSSLFPTSGLENPTVQAINTSLAASDDILKRLE